MSKSLTHRTAQVFRVLSLLLLCLVTLPALAQFGSSLSGTVQDPTEAVVGNAVVTLTNTATNQVQTTTSNDTGFYRFGSLPPGHYSVSVTAPGFKSDTLPDVELVAETPRNLNLTLQTGGTSETVNVTADQIPLLQTGDASINTTIESAQIQRLPTFGANPYELLRTAPGITGDAARAGNGTANFLPNGAGPGGSSSGIYQTENQTQISANGQRVANNNYLLDGVSVNSLSHGGSAVVTPNSEALASITVVSTSYDAGDGRNSGAQIKSVTKSGTNELHGSLFFLYDEPGLNAYNKWGGPTGGPRLRVSNKQRTYAASLGGPIIKDKLFLFGSYQGFGQGNNGTAVGWVETNQYRSTVQTARPGSVTTQIFNSAGIQPRVVSVLNRGCADYAANQGMYPGQTVASGPWCQAVAGGIDIGSPTPGGASQIGIYPKFSRPATGQPSPEEVGGGLDGIPDLQYVQLAIPGHSRGNQFNGRVDYNLTQKDLLAGSVYFTKLDSYGSGNVNSRAQGDVPFKPLNSAGTLIYIHTFSPTIINELRGNFTRFFDNGVKDGGGLVNYGIPEVHTEGLPVNQIQFGLPRGTGSFFAQNHYEVRDTVSKTFGAHTLRIGVEIRREQDNDNTVASQVRPVYSFRGLWNLANDTPIYEGVIANPLTGGAPTIGNHLRSEYYSGFVQHDWKVTPQFTLNTGLRWELFTPLRNKDFPLNYPVLGGPGRELIDIKLTPHDRLWNTQYKNFGPKVGFAYNPTRLGGKLVLRGGFALAYNHLDAALFNVAQQDNGPGLANYGLCCGTPTDWFSTPFAGGTIKYGVGTSNSFNSYPINPALATGIGPNGFPSAFNGVSPATEAYGARPNTQVPYSYLYSLETEYELPYQTHRNRGLRRFPRSPLRSTRTSELPLRHQHRLRTNCAERAGEHLLRPDRLRPRLQRTQPSAAASHAQRPHRLRRLHLVQGSRPGLERRPGQLERQPDQPRQQRFGVRSVRLRRPPSHHRHCALRAAARPLRQRPRQGSRQRLADQWHRHLSHRLPLDARHLQPQLRPRQPNLRHHQPGPSPAVLRRRRNLLLHQGLPDRIQLPRRRHQVLQHHPPHRQNLHPRHRPQQLPRPLLLRCRHERCQGVQVRSLRPQHPAPLPGRRLQRLQHPHPAAAHQRQRQRRLQHQQRHLRRVPGCQRRSHHRIPGQNSILTT